MESNIVQIKKSDLLALGDFLLERNRFDKNNFIIYKIVDITYSKDHMVLLNVLTRRKVDAQISCHHSQGSRFTWLTYKFTEVPAAALLYENYDT